MKQQFVISVAVIFVALTAALYALKINMPAYQFNVLEAGNIIMAILTLVTFLIVSKHLEVSTMAFVRGVYSASFLKLMVCMISILVYVLLNKANIHKPSVFVLFGIYAVYTIVETWLLSKIVRK